MLAPALCVFEAEAQLNQSKIEIVDVRVRAAVPGAAKTSVYFAVVNHSDEPDVLVGVSSPQAERGTFIKTTWKGLTPRVVQMTAIEIPAQSIVPFKAGGLECRLLRPTVALRPGDTITLELRFKRLGRVAVTATVFNRLL
jgi:copper(I)-binding protein